ncbi:magnesium/cobalt efflux protein, partial [Pseudomonas sp. HMWF010]
MPSDDSSHKPAVPERQSRGVRAFFRKLRQRLVPPGEPERSPDPVEAGADDIVDQAEAFKSLRVADLMIPRADVVAVELSTPFEALVAQFTEAENSRMPIYRETL